MKSLKTGFKSASLLCLPCSVASDCTCSNSCLKPKNRQSSYRRAKITAVDDVDVDMGARFSSNAHLRRQQMPIAVDSRGGVGNRLLADDNLDNGRVITRQPRSKYSAPPVPKKVAPAPPVPIQQQGQKSTADLITQIGGKRVLPQECGMLGCGQRPGRSRSSEDVRRSLDFLDQVLHEYDSDSTTRTEPTSLPTIVSSSHVDNKEEDSEDGTQPSSPNEQRRTKLRPSPSDVSSNARGRSQQKPRAPKPPPPPPPVSARSASADRRHLNRSFRELLNRTAGDILGADSPSSLPLNPKVSDYGSQELPLVAVKVNEEEQVVQVEVEDEEPTYQNAAAIAAANPPSAEEARAFLSSFLDAKFPSTSNLTATSEGTRLKASMARNASPHKSTSDIRGSPQEASKRSQERSTKGTTRRNSSADNWTMARSPATTLKKVLKPADLQQPPRQMRNREEIIESGSGTRGKPPRRSQSTSAGSSLVVPSPTGTDSSSRSKPKRTVSAATPSGNGPKSLPVGANDQFYYFGCAPGSGSGHHGRANGQQEPDEPSIPGTASTMLSYKQCQSVEKLQRSPADSIEDGRTNTGSSRSSSSPSGPFSLINPNITLPTPPTPLPDYSDTSDGDEESSSFPSDIDKPVLDKKERRGSRQGKRVRRKPSSVRNADRARRTGTSVDRRRNDDSSFSDDSLESSDDSQMRTSLKEKVSAKQPQEGEVRKASVSNKGLPGIKSFDMPRLGKEEEEMSTLKSDKTTTGAESIWSSASFDFVDNQEDYDLYKSVTRKQEMEEAAARAKLEVSNELSSLDKKLAKVAPTVKPEFKAKSMLNLSNQQKNKMSGKHHRDVQTEGLDESDCCCPHCEGGDLSSCYCSCSCCEDHEHGHGSDSDRTDSRKSETGTVKGQKLSGMRPERPQIFPTKIALPNPLPLEKPLIHTHGGSGLEDSLGSKKKEGRKSADRSSLSSIDSGTKTSFSGSNKSPSRSSPASSPSGSSHGGIETEVEVRSQAKNNRLQAPHSRTHQRSSSSDSNYNSDDANNVHQRARRSSSSQKDSIDSHGSAKQGILRKGKSEFDMVKKLIQEGKIEGIDESPPKFSPPPPPARKPSNDRAKGGSNVNRMANYYEQQMKQNPRERLASLDSGAGKAKVPQKTGGDRKHPPEEHRHLDFHMNDRIMAAHKQHLDQDRSPSSSAGRQVPILPLSKLNLPPHLQPAILSSGSPNSLALFPKPYMPMSLGEPILMHKPFQLSADGSRLKKESFTQKIKRHLSNAGSKVNRSKSFYQKDSGFDPSLRGHEDVLRQMEARRNKLALGDMSLSESSLVHAAKQAQQNQEAAAGQHSRPHAPMVPKKVQPPAVLRQLRAREHQSFRAANSNSAGNSSTLPHPGRPAKGPAPKAPAPSDTLKRSASIHTPADASQAVVKATGGFLMPRSPKAHRPSFFKGFRRKKTYILEG